MDGSSLNVEFFWPRKMGPARRSEQISLGRKGLPELVGGGRPIFCEHPPLNSLQQIIASRQFFRFTLSVKDIAVETRSQRVSQDAPGV